jgi:hypothetical protein
VLLQTGGGGLAADLRAHSGEELAYTTPTHSGTGGYRAILFGEVNANFVFELGGDFSLPGVHRHFRCVKITHLAFPLFLIISNNCLFT